MRVVDLFCGAGGFSKGFEDAGFEVIAGFDFEPTALRIHAANMPTIPRWTLGARGRRRLPDKVLPHGLGRHVEADLMSLLEWSATIAELAPDVIIGGPPCQPFSSSGKRKGDADERAKLTEAFAVIVTSARPRFFCMENVKGVLKSEVYRRAMVLFKRAGYGITAMEMTASKYGVGQRRTRWIVVGALGETDNWLASSLEAAASPTETTVADVLGTEVGKLYFRRGHSAEGGRRSFVRTDEPAMTTTSTVTRRGNAKAGYALRKADIEVLDTLAPEDLESLIFLYPGGSSSAGSRSIHEPLSTVTRRAADAPGEGYKPRRGDVVEVSLLPILSIEQISRLSGFPANWTWLPPGRYISKADRMIAIANAVAPPMACAIAKCILAHTRNEVIPVTHSVPKTFGIWLRRETGMSKDAAAQRMSEVRAALRLLGSRDLPNIDVAGRYLENTVRFQTLSVGRRSNLRTALKLWYRFRDPEWMTYDPANLAFDPEEKTGVIPASIDRLRLRLRAKTPSLEAAE